MVDIIDCTKFKVSKLGNIPIDWEIVKLQSVTELITDGSHFSPVPQKDITGYKIASVKDLKDYGIVPETCAHILESDFVYLQRNNCVPVYGDVLLSKDGTVGKTCVWKDHTNISLLSSLGLIRVNNSKLLPDFLKYFLDSGINQSWLKRSMGGSALQRIVLRDIRSLSIPITILPEQKKIADILSTVDEAIQNTKAQIEKTKELKRGLMQKLFSEGIGHTEFKDSKLGRIPKEWEVVRVSELGTFRKGKGISKKELVQDGIPCVRYGELYTKHHEVIRNYFSSIPEAITKGLVKLKRGDLLFAGSGETLEDIGKSAVFITDDLAYAGGDIVILSLDKIIDPTFAGYLFNSMKVRNQLSRRGQGGTVMHIYSSGISEVVIALPTIDEQLRITNAFLLLDDKVEARLNELDYLKVLKKGLMQKLLTGKVRVKI